MFVRNDSQTDGRSAPHLFLRRILQRVLRAADGTVDEAETAQLRTKVAAE